MIMVVRLILCVNVVLRAIFGPQNGISDRIDWKVKNYLGGRWLREDKGGGL